MNKVDLSLFDNSSYQPGNTFKRSIWWLCSYVFINTFFPWPSFLKKAILRIFGLKMGQNVTIKQNINIKYPWFLELGDNVWLGEGVWIDNLARVKIGSNVCISQGALLLTGNHNFKKKGFDLILGEISIEDGVWVGAKSTVCPGVCLQSHAVLSVGSVATKNCKAYHFYQGNPAEIVRKREVI